MGCFLACFCSSCHRKPKPSGTIVPSQPHTHEAARPAEPAKPEDIEEPLFPVSESKESVDEHQKPDCCGKKKVTFDLIVKTHEKLPTKNVVEEIGNDEIEKKDKSPNESELGSASTRVSHPPILRCQNSIHIGNEHDLSGLEVSEFNGDSGKDEEEERENDWQATFVQEESSESLFSLSIDSRKHIYGGETGDKEVNSPMPVCDSPEKKLERVGSNLNPQNSSNNDVLSVLIPVENLTQWKSTKTRIATPASSKHRQDKENVCLKQDCVTMASGTDFKLSALKPKLNQDLGVDTSLSNWLVPKTSLGSPEEVSSVRSYEDKPKLGFVGVEEMIELSASNCSPSQSHDIVLGTVGSYWSHTGQTLDSNSSSCCKEGGEEVAREVKVQWKSDPFEAKLVAEA